MVQEYTTLDDQKVKSNGSQKGKLILLQKIEDLIPYLHSKVVKFPRTDREWGKKIDNTMMELLELVLTANMQRDKRYKVKFFEQADIKLAVLKHLVRVACEMHMIQGEKVYAKISLQETEIGMLLGGLINHFTRLGKDVKKSQ